MKSEPSLLSIIVETYKGDIDQDGFYHGQGVAILKGGLTYNGCFERGKMHGEGTLTWPNGTIFTGILCQNEITGKGMVLLYCTKNEIVKLTFLKCIILKP